MPSSTPLLAKLAERLPGGANNCKPVRSQVSPDQIEQRQENHTMRPFVLKFATSPLQTQRRQPPETIFTALQRETTDDR